MKTTLKRGTGRGSSNGSNGHATVPPRSPLTPIARYGGPPRRSWPRRIGKTLLWIVVVVLMAAGALAGGAWIYINESVSGGSASHAGGEGGARSSSTFRLRESRRRPLSIGYDQRCGDRADLRRLTPDTVMLIRGEPEGQHHLALLVPA